MTSLTLKDLGLLSQDELAHRLDEVDLLIQCGFHIYPCYAVTPFGCACKLKHKDKKEWGKHPTGRSSHKTASSLPAVKLWWVENPYDNVAINPELSGCVVIDIDPRSGGHISWENFLKKHEIELPNTVMTLTGEYVTSENEKLRGYHLWFRVQEPASFIQNFTELGYEGIDVKYNGGVMAPPSRHASGVTYEWAPGKSPLDVEIAELPDPLLKLIRRKVGRSVRHSQSVGYKYPRALASETVEELLSVPLLEGNRVVGLYKLTCRVAYRLGVNTPDKVQEVTNLMLHFNQTMVIPPLEGSGADNPDLHIRNAIDWIARNTDDA
jgi:hypothetical protein